MSKIKVMISGIHYPLSMMGYFIRAFERRNDVELYTSGPFTGAWIPWNGGMNLSQKYVKTPTFPLPSYAISANVPSSMIVNQLPCEMDLWLEIDAGWRFIDKPPAKVVAQIQTDPHVLKNQYIQHRSRYDYAFCMQGKYIYDKEIYLPYAYDPNIHYAVNDVKIEYDTCLIGLHYQQRDQLIQALKSQNISTFYGIGIVYDEYREAYSKSKIALSWSSLDDLPARVWEAMGMETPLVTNRVPDLANFFVEGEHYLGFSNVDEAVNSVKWLLENPLDAQEMADNAHRKVMTMGTWDHRVEQILENCKLT